MENKFKSDVNDRLTYVEKPCDCWGQCHCDGLSGQTNPKIVKEIFEMMRDEIVSLRQEVDKLNMEVNKLKPVEVPHCPNDGLLHISTLP